MVVQDESTGAVHRNTGFRWLWASNALQETGRQFATLALSVTAVAVLGAEAWQVGVISALGLSAYLVIGLPAGVWVDRWPKRPVLVCTELIRAVAAASVAVAYIAGWLSVWQLMVVAAIISVTSVFSDTAQTAFTPAIVGPSRVSKATARIQSTDTSMQVVGPALAAAVLTRLTAPLLYVFTSVTGILAAVAASLIRAPEPREKGVADRGDRVRPAACRSSDHARHERPHQRRRRRLRNADRSRLARRPRDDRYPRSASFAGKR